MKTLKASSDLQDLLASKLPVAVAPLTFERRANFQRSRPDLASVTLIGMRLKVLYSSKAAGENRDIKRLHNTENLLILA